MTITTYASFASLWLVPRLPEFQRLHPGIDIRIDASDRMVDLESEDVDVAIRWLRPGAPVPTDATLLLTEDASPALSPRLLATRETPLREPSDLASLPILAMDETVPSAPYSSWARWCEFAGVAAVRRRRAPVLHLCRPVGAGGGARPGRGAGAHAVP